MKFPIEDARVQQLINSGYDEDQFKIKFDEVVEFIKFPKTKYSHYYYVPNLSRYILFQSIEHHLDNDTFEQFYENEYLTLDRFSDKGSIRYVNTCNFDADESITLDKNSCHMSIIKTMDLPCSKGIFKTVDCIDLKNQKIEYYLVTINPNDRPEYIYPKNIDTQDRKIIWLSNFQIQIFKMYNKLCELVIQDNNNYTYLRYVRCSNKLMSNICDERNKTGNKLYKQILNIMVGLTMIKKSNTNTSGIIDDDSKQTKNNIIVQRINAPLYPELYRAFHGIYAKARLLHSMKIKILLDNNIMIYRIISDDICFQRSNLLDGYLSDKSGSYKKIVKYTKRGHFDNTCRFIQDV